MRRHMTEDALRQARMTGNPVLLLPTREDVGGLSRHLYGMMATVARDRSDGLCEVTVCGETYAVPLTSCYKPTAREMIQALARVVVALGSEVDMHEGDRRELLGRVAPLAFARAVCFGSGRGRGDEGEAP